MTKVTRLSLLFLLFIVNTAYSQGLTTGSLILTTTFEAISYRAQFTGDSNANATVFVQFKKSTDTTWSVAYTPYIDRRATIGGVSNPFNLEARGSIVGLLPSISYDIQVTWTDPNGVTGTNPVTGSITTLTYFPPTGSGTLRTVTDNATLTTALAAANPGDTIHLNSGTYNAFSITRSGNSGAWIILEGESNGTTNVTGSGVARNVFINSNFIIIQNLTLNPSDSSGIVIAANNHHIFVQDVTMQNISALCAANPSGHYNDGGIVVGNPSHDIYLLRNAINSTALSNPACTLSPIYDSPGTGISWQAGSTFVAKSNIITGGFRDAISQDNTNNNTDNVDMQGNTVSGYKDDGIESKGSNLNVRLWSNVILADAADTCIALNNNPPLTNLYGPAYIFRNTCRVTTSNPTGETAYKLGPSTGTDYVPTYIFHNSIDSTGASGGTRWDGYVGRGAVTALNNILKSSGTIIDYAAASSVFDYNIGFISSGAGYVFHWNGTTDYATFSTFRTGTGQEAHGYNVNPLFTNTDLHIDASSPAYDKGVLIPNFNSLDSAWSYSGVAPDIGAFEFGTVAPPNIPSPPTNLHIQYP